MIAAQRDRPVPPMVPEHEERPRKRALPRPAAGRLNPEFGVSAFLLVAGVAVLIGTAAIAPDASHRGPVGPQAVPMFLGIGLCVIGVLHALDVARGGHGEAEGGEDIELGAPADFRTVGLLVVAFVSNILLIEVVGWPLSGALMFWIAAQALGSRHPARDLPLALLLGILTYELFSRLLDIALPGGLLQGVL